MRLSADSTHNPNGTIDIIQNHLAEMIFSFGKTEGLPFTYQQTRELLFGDKADAMTWREITTILNLRDAFDFLFDNWHYPVELGTVFDYNARVGGHDLEPNAGYARENYKVIISGVDYVPDDIYAAEEKRLIDEALDVYADPIELAIYYCLTISKRQFCCNGNKRTGLMICNHVLSYYDMGFAFAPIYYAKDAPVFDSSYIDLLKDFYEEVIDINQAIDLAKAFLLS